MMPVRWMVIVAHEYIRGCADQLCTLSTESATTERPFPKNNGLGQLLAHACGTSSASR